MAASSEFPLPRGRQDFFHSTAASRPGWSWVYDVCSSTPRPLPPGLPYPCRVRRKCVRAAPCREGAPAHPPPPCPHPLVRGPRAPAVARGGRAPRRPCGRAAPRQAAGRGVLQGLGAGGRPRRRTWARVIMGGVAHGGTWGDQREPWPFWAVTAAVVAAIWRGLMLPRVCERLSGTLAMRPPAAAGWAPWPRSPSRWRPGCGACCGRAAGAGPGAAA